MPRKLLLRSDLFPYHVTARTNNRELFPISLDAMWDIFGSECHSIQIKTGAKIHAFVMMPNHFHMLMSTPALDLGRTMNIFMRNITTDCHKVSGRSGRLFGGPYHWSLITSAEYYAQALKYVYQNPVKANLCDRVDEYKFSTYAGLIGHCKLPFPIHFTGTDMEWETPGTEPIHWLEWLNQAFSNESEKIIRQNLRRRIFKLGVDRKARRPIRVS